MMEDFAHTQSWGQTLGDHAVPFATRDDRRGILVIADQIEVQDLAPLAHAAGMRLQGAVTLEDAPARLDNQIGCDALLVFCPAMSPLFERLLVQVETQAIQTGMTVILVAGWATIDLAFACVRSPSTYLLCDPDQTELAATLVAAGQRPSNPGLVQEVDPDGVRLQQLSDEVSRLARTIEALALQPRMASPSFDIGGRISDRPSDYIGMPALMPLGTESVAEKSAEITAIRVRDLLRARRMRADFLPGDLFADPAWDMVLDLLAARLEHERVSVSSLCIAADVPPTTALRWIRTLTDRGLVVRQADPHDGRRIFIALADGTADSLIRWFGASRRYLCG